jgi:hypothetical protein
MQKLVAAVVIDRDIGLGYGDDIAINGALGDLAAFGEIAGAEAMIGS